MTDRAVTSGEALTVMGSVLGLAVAVVILLAMHATRQRWGRGGS
ncbi:hypothetical protein [Aminobacter ciceronei]|uniref:Uncharacterized protein n=1 Tax=Aminobacter ciceronei TaxID=150723 RepID=A0ABR6C3H1_9HYPH|nr:hypothetical protein [Aminobacter ciceronei]MBA8905487.1 hypothetical protein [Aminobacter ciceronei]MBA9019213.1 hypothetical protein [Aminobacter ciceronei]